MPSIDLFLTDLLLPDMSGSDLVSQIRDSKSESRVLYISGFASDDARRSMQMQDAEFLARPFNSEELLVRVRQILDAG